MSASQPVISTIVLNWNRKDLLEKTLQSLAATTTVPHELILIDNGSTDGSADFIREFAASNENPARCGAVRTILLENNIGGIALNQGIELAAGRLVHLSENDLIYHPGWDLKVVEKFEVFPTLGQLSVFGPVPTDQEAWELKACRMLHSGGHILYQTDLNVGTSSVLRREVVGAGVRVKNLASSGEFKFPADGELSEAVRKAGYVVAWNDRYLVTNVGHFGSEIESRLDYYRKNYESKEWFRIEGMERRLAEWRRRPRPKRSSLIFDREEFSPEISQPSAECPEPQLWTMIDSWTAEVESLEFIYSLVRLVKPKNVLETGTWLGAGAVAIARALADNGRGKLVTLELDPECCAFARKRIEAYGLSELATVIETKSLEYMPDEEIDFLFLDSAIDIRGAEFRHFQPRLRPGSLVVFHDTSSIHSIVREQIDQLVRQGHLHGVFVPTPRGIAITQYRDKTSPKKRKSLRMVLGKVKARVLQR
jgi:predicted O-methyltransferase YrrM